MTASLVRKALRKERKVSRKAIMQTQTLLENALGKRWGPLGMIHFDGHYDLVTYADFPYPYHSGNQFTNKMEAYECSSPKYSQNRMSIDSALVELFKKKERGNRRKKRKRRRRPF